MEKPNLSRVIFWDTDYDQIDWSLKARFVIERVVMFGTFEDWKTIQLFYGMDKIKDSVLNSRELDPKTLNYFSLLFKVPKDQFRCYNILQSNQGHWSY
ncbi:MAG TPA: hypothetical protein PK509_00645 [Catalimonadaceae bacterium]|jgi:hypothetical protein|nr:hypothetical protein [Catalimonadaceae bacterium]